MKKNQSIICMHNLFIKRLKSRKKQFFGSSSIFFILFSTLNILFLFCWNFFSNIYLFSFGYNNDYYYSYNDVNIKEAEETYPIEDIAFSYDIENKIEDETIIFEAFVSPNTFLEEYGIRLTNRLFVNMKVKDKDIFSNMESMDYCIISENYRHERNSLSKNGKEYPILSTFQLEMTSAIISSLRTSNIKDMQLALFVEKTIDKDKSAQIIVKGHEEAAEKDDLISGKTLNDEYKEGYTIFQPMFYVGFLIPYLFACISMFFILSSMQTLSMKENDILYLLGMKKRNLYFLVLNERTLEMLLGFLASILIFTPILIPITKTFFYVAFINFAIQLLYVLLILIFYTLKETKRKFR